MPKTCPSRWVAPNAGPGASRTRCPARHDGESDGHYSETDGGSGLWFGGIDDVWRPGKPVGRVGPWWGSPVEAHVMTGSDRKTLDLSRDAAEDVTFSIEVDVAHSGWHTCGAVAVPPGEALSSRTSDRLPSAVLDQR